MRSFWRGKAKGWQINDSISILLPITCFNDQVGYFFQTDFIFVIKTIWRETIQIQNTQDTSSAFNVKNERTNNLTLGFAVACNMPWVKVDLRNHYGFGLYIGIGADSFSLSWSSLNKLTGGLPTEWAK